MELLWAVLMVWASRTLAAPVTSHNISVHCTESMGMTRSVALAPSPLAALKASLSVEGGQNMLDISWAVRIDSTSKYITGIEIDTSQETLKCEYIPSLVEAISRSLIPETQQQIWFHHKLHVLDADLYLIHAGNLPLPPPENGPAYKETVVYAPAPVEDFTNEVSFPYFNTTEAPDTGGRSALLLPVGGGLLVALMLLLFGYVTYKAVGAGPAAGFLKVPLGPPLGPRVPVLVVYPAQGELLQAAVLALAELLQGGGCSLALDLWQQGRVASLGPLRWLLEQVQAAHRVLIIAPQSFPQASLQKVPGASPSSAAARDLFPLALNLVAGRAKNRAELAKFWVVRFGETPPLTSELQACRTFCLMKDLSKLCTGLQSQKPDVLLRRANGNEKLRAAVSALVQGRTKSQPVT